MKAKAVIILIPTLVTIAGLFLLLSGLNQYRLGKSSLDWKTTEGVITRSVVKSRTEKNITQYRPEVAYTYEIGDRTYEGTTLSFKDESANREDAYFEAQSYPVNQGVKVYFDPKKPKSSVLIPGPGSLFNMKVILGSVLLVIMAALIVYSLIPDKRSG